MSLYDSFCYEGVDAFNVPQVEPEPEPVSPDAEEEEDAQGEEESDNHVQALAVERSGVCAGIDDGIFVDVHDDDVVAAVVELIDECFHPFAEHGGVLVLPFAEEDVDVVGDTTQVHGLSAFDAELRELAEALRQGGVGSPSSRMKKLR